MKSLALTISLLSFPAFAADTYGGAQKPPVPVPSQQGQQGQQGPAPSQGQQGQQGPGPDQGQGPAQGGVDQGQTGQQGQQGQQPVPTQGGKPPAQQQQDDDTITFDGDADQAPSLAGCQINALTFANVLFNQQGNAQQECNALQSLLGNNSKCQVKRRGNRFLAQLRLQNVINAQNLADGLNQLGTLITNGKLQADKVLGIQVTNNGGCQ